MQFASGSEVAEAVGLGLRARLRRVREALLAADPNDGATVTELALDYGFFHLGRFAVDYRNEFGETPSSSLHALRNADSG